MRAERAAPPLWVPAFGKPPPGSHRLFLLPTTARRRPALSGPPPRPPALPRADRAVPPGTAPPRLPYSGRRSAPPPAQAASPHPGTDSSRPDSGTMVMAEGTAVLRRNRPGTKAQVPYLHLCCGGDSRRRAAPLLEAGGPRRGGGAGAWAGARAPGLLFRSRSPSVWPSRGGPRGLRSPFRRAGAAEARGWGPVRRFRLCLPLP